MEGLRDVSLPCEFSSVVKMAALSEMITSDRPSVANVVLSKLIVVAAELEVVL